jgi:transmembrane sensor
MDDNLHSHTAPSADAEQAASLWLARRDAGLSAAEELAFQQWLAADLRHAAAWTELESAWRAFDAPRRDGGAEEMVRELAARRHRRRWRRSMAIAAGMAAVAAAVVVLLVRPDRSRGVISRTEHRVLDDGSIVLLDRGAKIEVDFTPGRRSVRLVQGEALFSVTKNAARPFIVASGDVEVQAVGTAFVVKASPESVDVIVTEGRVAVGRTNPVQNPVQGTGVEAPPLLVAAGGRVVVARVMPPEEQMKVEVLTPGEMARQLAWSGPRLELAATPLSDAAVLFNRENRIQLAIADPQAARFRLSGVFRADDPEGFVRLLEANYPIAAIRRGDVIELHSK